MGMKVLYTHKSHRFLVPKLKLVDLFFEGKLVKPYFLVSDTACIFYIMYKTTFLTIHIVINIILNQYNLNLVHI